MEIYREQPEDIVFKLPPESTRAVVSVYRGVDKIGEDQIFEDLDENGFIKQVAVNIPYKAVRYDGAVVVLINSTVDGEVFQNRYNINVVTPVLSLLDTAEIIGNGATLEQARRVERSVRVIIETVTGQSFGLERAAYGIMGKDTERLQLPKRLVAYKAISVSGVPITSIRYNVTGDGWYVETLAPEWLEIKEAPPEDLWSYHTNGPIRVPAWYKSVFTEGRPYTIDGLWGWESVPMDVEEAARLLVNDYSCNQSAYRDRYLEIIKSSDWTLQYSEQAWEGTGNARADLILNQYKRPFLLIV